MKTVLAVIVLVLSVVGMAVAVMPVRMHTGTGTSNPIQGDTRAMWSEPPDMNGVIAGSEQILQFNLESEIANDFVPTEPTITHATWWGGFFNNTTPCESGMTTPGFNLEFFAAGNCIPGDLVAYLSITDFSEETIGCQIGEYPLVKYGTDVTVNVVPGGTYWFCAQMKDHPFPPQWGRLASANIIGCDGQGRSAYFGEPNWIGACSWVFESCDFSEEFDGDHSEACCFPDHHCEYVLTRVCLSEGGTSQGPGTTCDPNPCHATAAQTTRWGTVRSLFR